MLNDCESQLKDYYCTICKAKEVEGDLRGLDNYITAMTTLYHAVCLDIDDTLTYTYIKQKRCLVKALARLTKLNIIICYITGRGKSNAFDFLSDLKNSIMNYDSNIRESQFRRWYCITNNGYMLFRSDFLNEHDFLSHGDSLVDIAEKAKYSELKPMLQSEIAALLSRRLGVDKNDIIHRSNSSIGDNSLRFPFAIEFESDLDDGLIYDIRTLVTKHTRYPFGVSRGIYHKNNQIVIEISMTTKGRAIDKFEKYLGIPEHKMVRIGDQGDNLGNDFEMLNNGYSFSVGKFSSIPDVCWPVVRKKPELPAEIITGVDATVELLNCLKLFPTICLEKPNETIYLPRLAVSEQKNLAANYDTYNYYENQLKYALKNNYNRFFSVWDFMEKRTGGFFIYDSEYELLKAERPDHILFQIYDIRLTSPESNLPRLKFALRTDNGLLLRGPLNYYYGLSFRNKNRDNINKSFLISLNQNRIYYFKTCINAININCHVRAKDSIAQRVMLSIMDSIRDYLLILINVYVQEKVETKDTLYIFSEEDQKLFDLYNLAKENLIYMYNCLFDKININFTQQFLDFLKNRIMPVAIEAETHMSRLENFDYKRACRVWREIDSFYENVIAVDTSINKLLYECEIEKKELLLYGIRYGSLELPIIAAMLLEVKYKYFNIKYSIGTLCLRSDYKINHSGKLDTKRTLSTLNCKGLEGSGYFHVLMDDNLVTGRTLQIAVNMLVNHNIYPDRLIVVRYPTLNRIKHMYLPDHGAPDTDLFWEYVYGLTSPTPYTKLNTPRASGRSSDDKYLDELGQFNKTRTFVLELLYKNGWYKKPGDVARVGE